MDHKNVKDFSSEIVKSVNYVKLLTDHFVELDNYEKDGSMVLSKHKAGAFLSMLFDVQDFLEDVDRELYPSEEQKKAA